MRGRSTIALLIAGCAPAPAAATIPVQPVPPTTIAASAAPAPPPATSILPAPTAENPPPPSGERAIILFRGRVRRCWREAAAADPKLSFAMDVDLQVAADGTVTNVVSRPRGQGARHAGLIACIEDGARKVVFEPRDAPTTVTIPFVLTSK